MFEALDARYHFCFDLAATSKNSKCGPFYVAAGGDGIHWHQMNRGGDGWLWCNPPYSKPNLPRFTAKAREEVQLGAAIVMLVPATVDAGWFQDNVMAGADVITKRTVIGTPNRLLDGWELELALTGGAHATVRFLRRRIDFFNPHQKTDGQSAKTGSCLIEWRPRRLL